jgi:hypothetical protein
VVEGWKRRKIVQRGRAGVRPERRFVKTLYRMGPCAAAPGLKYTTHSSISIRKPNKGDTRCDSNPDWPAVNLGDRTVAQSCAATGSKRASMGGSGIPFETPLPATAHGLAAHRDAGLESSTSARAKSSNTSSTCAGTHAHLRSRHGNPPPLHHRPELWSWRGACSNVQK